MASRVRIGPGAAIGLLLLALPVLLLSAAALARQQPATPETVATLPHLAGEPRRFYITGVDYHSDVVLDACVAGYHTANLYEILGPSGLDYATHLASAKKRGDQGTGPVAGWWGWVRTGNDSSVSNTAGRANCALWTSAISEHYGTIVRLAETWTASGVAISPWQAQTWSCAGAAPVWCVSDTVYGGYLPLVLDGG